MTHQLPLKFVLRDRFTFERFAVGPNVELVETLRAPPAGHRCIWVWGRAGAGKSHLLQAVCHETGGAYIPAREIRQIDGYEAFERVLIDDADAWIGDREMEEPMLALYNEQLRFGGELVVTAKNPPTRASFAVADLASRLKAAACFELLTVSDEAAIPVLRRAADDRGLQLPDEVVTYLLRRADRDLPELLGLLEVIDREALAASRRLTVPFVKEVLAHTWPAR